MNLALSLTQFSFPTIKHTTQPATKQALGAKELSVAIAIAEALIPPGKLFEGGGKDTAQRLCELLSGSTETMVNGVRALLWTVEIAPLSTHKRVFSSLPLEHRKALLESWVSSPNPKKRNLTRALLLPFRLAHFNDATYYGKVGARFEFPPPALTAVERWRRQVIEGDRVEEDLELECDVVVVGTGAGGAACAYQLASKGRAVVLVEEGSFYDRRQFNGRPDHAYKKLYRDGAMTVALGNISMPVWAGRAVGGSTVINSGTCYRAPERVFARWRRSYGLTDFSTASMAPYYERVDSMLGVSLAEKKYLGGVATVIARGADALGLHHGPVPRNAPGCDGAGVCAFGCPTGAKRSTDVSYVPEALLRGAQLITRAQVRTIDVSNGRATGITARLGSGKQLKVKASAVVIAAGALVTPNLLRHNQLATQSGWLGKNLSVHPASKVMAVFEENIDMSNGIPQSYAIEDLANDGIMFEGSSLPPSVTAIGIWYVGDKFTELMDSYRNLAMFGFMIQDHGRGRVLPGYKGSPLILYNLAPSDVLKLQRAAALLSEVFLAAGAKRVLPFVHGHYELSTIREIDQFRTASLKPGDFELTAYHPLGTCRIGTDKTRSCLGPDHQVHGTKSLYVVDGSAVPSSLGVNPQLTIMAMALRAGEIIDSQLG